jgi:hypothetical protein
MFKTFSLFLKSNWTLYFDVINYNIKSKPKWYMSYTMMPSFVASDKEENW